MTSDMLAKLCIIGKQMRSTLKRIMGPCCIGSANSRVMAWHSECRTGEMDDVGKSRLPGASQAKWNFH